MLNTAFNINPPFSLLGRAESNGTTVAEPALHGIQFTLTTQSIGATSGTFLVSWADANGAAADNLPISIDFALMVNGGSNGDGYLFTGVNHPGHTYLRHGQLSRDVLQSRQWPGRDDQSRPVAPGR